jgi:hypothetical protein
MLAKREKCLPDGKDRPEDQRIAISEMFDMIAGSETGAIIASTLVIKNKDSAIKRNNAHFADKAVKFFEEHSSVLYRDSNMSSGVRFVLTFMFIVLGGFLGYKLGEYLVTIENFYEIVDNLKEYCKKLQIVYIYNL